MNAYSNAHPLSLFLRSPARFKAHFFVSLAMLIIAMYLSTGTLSPYANTVDFPPDYPLVEPKCHYLFNGDYYQLAALYYLLKGKPRESWEYTMHLRRILYNVLAYPFMRLFDHDRGGLIANFLLTICAFVSFALFSRKTIGEAGTIAGMWLLALFPGIFYYSGQPFLYSLIVPGCLWTYMLFWKLDQYASPAPAAAGVRAQPFSGPRTPWFSVFLVCLGIGLFFIAYDFIVYFLPATLFLLVYRKRYAALPAALLGLLLFSGIWWCIVRFGLHASFASQNTVFYANVVQSYCSPIDFTRWLGLLARVPEFSLVNFLFSCFLFLPVFFISAMVLGYLKKRVRLQAFEVCLLMSFALVFLFNNCAPPYDKPWKMRGDWIARLYEPMFAVMLFYCMRVVQDLANSKNVKLGKWILQFALIFVIFGNGVVSFGPVLNDPAGISSWVYWKFYKHAPKETMKKNLALYGRRPWGFCR